ncbi:MAG TPA: adenylate/guanylate cyclase domain-containing protein [Lichenihabitans sp.]|jgi:adenylate cyclase|nr:adenylate/guanylate cyclase domain-containing protein [Lichenihabitans sp.]
MDAVSPAASEGRWPRRRTAILDWLVGETRGERFLDNILVACCERLRQAGVPVGRATLHLRTDHPQWLGARILWRTGMADAEIRPTDYGVIDTDQFRVSPISAILAGADAIRERLDGSDDGDAYPVLDDLRRDGLTDYVVWPLDHTLGKRHVISFAADRPGGFSDEDLSLLADLLPALALVTEIRLKNRLARTLLETYVGPHASEHILSGSTRRGSGVTVGAAILICDLRGFTAISELWPRDDVIALLNDYFDAMSTPIERHGGEILKFIGDGLLAIFPLSEPEACENLLRAVAEARNAMASLNRDRATRGLGALGYGIGVHAGDVMYGNIGSRARLDFTVIGPAVNVAARLESLTKQVGRDALFSRDFVARLERPGALGHVGTFPLHGVGAPVEVFGLD